jgi:subtilisin family serine protease
MWAMTRGLSLALVGMLLVGLSAASAPAEKRPLATVARGPAAVVAVVDTGINPYHSTFRDDSPRAYQHPSTYIAGFPKDAKALHLTFDAPTWREAVLQDCERVWSKVKKNTLYWFPGTKIVGAISVDATGERSRTGRCEAFSGSGQFVLDTDGHGTMTASRATSREYGACGECLVVAVQNFDTASVQWAADNSDWIDLQSNSWGAIVPVFGPANVAGLNNSPDDVRAYEAAAKKHLAFWASGNGAATRGGVLGHPTTIDPRLTPSVVMVGGHDSGYINTWPGFPPHVVSDSCNSWAAEHSHLDRSSETEGSGTSSATPYAAGGAARILLEARRILGDRDTGIAKGIAARGRAGLVDEGPLADGKFTLDEWKEVVFKTATARPTGQHEDGPPCDVVDGLVLYSATPVKWEDVPEGYPEYLHIGYGAVDDPALELAFDVIHGRAQLPDRSSTDTFFAVDRQLREAQHQVYRGP